MLCRVCFSNFPCLLLSKVPVGHQLGSLIIKTLYCKETLLFWGCYVDGIDCEARTVLSVAAAEGSAGVVQVSKCTGVTGAQV